MAAPSGTKWGSIAGGYGRIGIHVDLTSTATVTTRVVTIWFWSKYSVDDSNNTLYWNNDATTATSSKGSVDIKTTVDSGSGWSTSNQKKLKTYTWEVDRGTSAKTYNCAAKLTGIDRVGATMSVSTSYTIPALASYEVTYNANGGTGAPATQTKYYGKALTLSSTIPTRSGYTFMGWGTSADDTSANYSEGSSYTSNSAITLYAIWKKTIKLTYNANGGSGAPASQSITVWNSTTKYEFTVSSTKPSRTGYTFLGWSLISTSASATYSGGNSIIISSNVTLYAIWKPYTHTLTYNANGGSGAPASQTKTYGVDLAVSSTKPTRTGHSFIEWNTKADGSGTSYKSGQVYEHNQNGGTITLYAIWKPYTYTIEYNANGGSGAPASQTKTYGKTLTLSSIIPTRTGYTFLGWSTGQYYTVPDYSAGDSYTENEGTTLYAVWKINSYKLTVNPNGGTWGGTTANTTAVQNYGTTKSIPVPTWAGHTFTGWTLSGGGSISSAEAVATVYTYDTSDGVLTARWDTNDYLVMFNASANGGVCSESQRTVEYNQAVGTLPTASKIGHTFLGWYTSPEGGTKVTSSYKVTGNVILYAQFKINSYTLTVNPNGGTWGGTTANTTAVQNYGTTKSIPVPTRTGYTFTGWTLSGGGSISSAEAVATVYTYDTSDGVLTAQWKINRHTVKFDASTNGGVYGNQGSQTASMTDTYDYGEVLGDLPNATRRNHTFLGWYTSPEGGTKVTSSYKVTGNVILYAQFELDATAYANDVKVWKEGVVYTNVNGTMKKGHAMVNVDGIWEDGICK